MTYTTEAVRQGVETTDHVVSKMLIASTLSTFLILGVLALT